jgi:hypothetical protein
MAVRTMTKKNTWQNNYVMLIIGMVCLVGTLLFTKYYYLDRYVLESYSIVRYTQRDVYSNNYIELNGIKYESIDSSVYVATLLKSISVSKSEGYLDYTLEDLEKDKKLKDSFDISFKQALIIDNDSILYQKHYYHVTAFDDSAFIYRVDSIIHKVYVLK